MAVQTDLTVVLEDRPGTLARVAQTLGNAGINIEGICALTTDTVGIAHLLVPEDRAVDAPRILEAAGIAVDRIRHVVVVPCPDRPGELGRVMGRIAAEDINCNLVYLTTSGHVVIGAEDIDRLAALFS
jgi:hypothetical protein